MIITNPSNSKRTKIYALHDTGSDATLMSIAVVKKLELHGKYRMVMCQGINGTHHIRGPFVGVMIKGIGHGESHLLHDIICLNQMPDIPESIPHKLDKENYAHLKQISTPKILKDGIDMVIGADNWSLMVPKDDIIGGKEELCAGIMPQGWTVYSHDYQKTIMSETVSCHHMRYRWVDDILHARIKKIIRTRFYGTTGR